MKLLNREEFLKLPAGTIYKKRSARELEIKGEWVSDSGSDWSSALFAADCDSSDQDTYLKMLYGESFPIVLDDYGRDGCFEDDEEFLVYEKWDLEQLKKILEDAIAVAPEQKFKNPW